MLGGLMAAGGPGSNSYVVPIIYIYLTHIGILELYLIA